MKAFITGITGQDGAYLAEFLVDKGYQVVGGFRRNSSANFWRLSELGIMNHKNLKLVEYDLMDLSSSIGVISSFKPDEIYNLAAQSFVGVSFEQPYLTGQVTGLGTLNLLEAIKITQSDARFYQASTSELYGLVQEVPQSETTPFYPRSPYAVAKLYAHWMTINYRESYNIFASCGILFNHESPLRGQEFVTRKITVGLSLIKCGKLNHLELGNLDAERDWGYAGDFVEGIWKVLQHNEPDTFVLSTGKKLSVRKFVEFVAEALDMTISWSGTGIDEKGTDLKTGKVIIAVSKEYFRPAEVEILLGDPSKAKDLLGWEATMDIEELSKKMAIRDYERVSSGNLLF